MWRSTPTRIDKTKHSFKNSVQKHALRWHEWAIGSVQSCCERESELTNIYAEQMITVQEQTLIAWQQTQSVQHPQAKNQQVPSESKGCTRATGTITSGQGTSINELGELDTVSHCTYFTVTKVMNKFLWIVDRKTKLTNNKMGFLSPFLVLSTQESLTITTDKVTSSRNKR